MPSHGGPTATQAWLMTVLYCDRPTFVHYFVSQAYLLGYGEAGYLVLSHSPIAIGETLIWLARPGCSHRAEFHVGCLHAGVCVDIRSLLEGRA